MPGEKLADYPVHLGLGGTAVAQPRFSGVEWYEAYGDRHDADGADGRLVALHTFTESWSGWEMHPVGAELVVCTEGAMTLIQERADGGHDRVALGAGDYAINPAGVWHTADVEDHVTALFVTAGLGTEHRAR
ncbi:hypothetical protein BH09GEM1_BH09GEM1_48180 [soil metagenome]